MNRKIKKIAAMAGLALACVGALSLVMIRANAGEQPDAASSETSSEIVLGTPNSIVVPSISSDADTSSAFVPSSGATESKALTVVSKPTSTPPKPTPPASSALTNKTKKPTYSSAPKASSSSSKASTATAGNNDPVFGNTTSPKGHMIIDKKTSSDGDINKQVGIMD